MSNNLKNIFTDIANAIRNKRGTSNVIKPANMSNEILSISTGTDTSDATATSSDILAGKTAYVKGIKIEGNILSYDGGYEEGVEIITGDSNIINVDEFPTENIDEEKIYKKQSHTNANVILYMDGEMSGMDIMGGSVEYYFINSFPQNPKRWDISGSNVYVYIMNDIAYVYTSLGDSVDPTWYTIGDFFTTSGMPLEDKGYVEDKTLITEQGVYVTYSESIEYGIKDKPVSQYDIHTNEWISVDSKIDKFYKRTFTYFNCSKYAIIPAYAFAGCSALSTIDGTENIEDIGDYSFYNCKALTSVSFPKVSTLLFGDYAFCGCSNLTEVSMPLLNEIGGDHFFKDCINLTNIYLPELNSIRSSYIFYGCENLQTISLPNLSSIQYGSNIFSNCTNLQNVDLPKLTTIVTEMFSECTNLTTINVPLVTEIRAKAFERCTSLTRITDEMFPSLNLLYETAFQGCTGLLEAKLSIGAIGGFEFCENLHTVDFSNAYMLGSNCFSGCHNLINTNFPNIDYFYTSAFDNCSKLQKLTFPKLDHINGYNSPEESYFTGFYECVELKTIDLGTLKRFNNVNCLFKSCKSLTKIILRNTEVIVNFSSSISDFKIVDENCYHFTGTIDAQYNPEGLKDGKIYVPDALVQGYKTAQYWSNFAEFIVGLSELQEEE